MTTEERVSQVFWSWNGRSWNGRRTDKTLRDFITAAIDDAVREERERLTALVSDYFAKWTLGQADAQELRYLMRYEPGAASPAPPPPSGSTG